MRPLQERRQSGNPAFSVGRTQEMLYFIRRIKTENLPEHPNFEVYIDSPLAVEATNVFHENISDCLMRRLWSLFRQASIQSSSPTSCGSIIG